MSAARWFVLAAALGAAAPALGQQPAAEPVPPAVASVVRITASVEGVDVENRALTVKGPRGRVVTLPVGPEVQQLEQVKPGDIVVVRYLEALALDLKRPAVRERAETASAAAKPGERPAAETRQLVAVAEVVGVDPRRQVVALRVGRRLIDAKVRDPNQLKALKVGDQVEAIYTEALVVAIEPAPGAARSIQVGS